MHAPLQRQAVLAALVALTAVVADATAEVSHRFVQIPLGYDSVIDVDEDGVVDYGTGLHGHGLSLKLTGSTWMNGFLSEFAQPGEEIGPPRERLYYTQVLPIYDFGMHSSYAIPIGTHLVGIEFIRDGAAHYGWLSMEVIEGPISPPIVAAIVEIAWESEPGTPIVAGWGDCDGNGLNDVLELLGGADLPDCNGDLVVDDCQPDADCNGNGLRDLCELGTPGVADCDDDLVPDSCQIAADPSLDCDGNGLFDWCELASDPSLDCDFDGVFDGCQIAADPALDSDRNGVLDTCQLFPPPSLDCDGDGILDAEQIAANPELDCNGDGVPDACDAAPLNGNGYALLLPWINSRVSVPSFGLVMPTTEITIEFWQRAERPAQQTTFRLDWSESNRCMAHVPWSDGRVYWDFGDPAIDGRLDYVPSEPIVDSWQHFAFQASAAGNFMRIYRNGVLEAEKVGSDALDPVDQPLVLGGTFYWEGFIGTLDEFRIWDHVRSAEEIAAHFAGTVDPASPGLVAYWRLDDGQGAVAADLAGGGSNPGSIVSDVGWLATAVCPLQGDLNGDGTVDGADLGTLLGAWGAAAPGTAADLNDDGVVDGADLGALLSHWS